MKVLFADGYNLFHRSRFGFSKGEFNIVFTFFRSFRTIVEQMDVDKVIVALEGYPKFRHELYPEYKGNRKVDPSDHKKAKEYADFRRQKDEIVRILSFLPVEVIRHPEYEGDDLIGKLVTSVYKDDECIVVTGDTDFIQLFNQHDDVKIYNPIKKEFVEAPGYDYVFWKSMVGDTSDNIKGISRVGPKTAKKIMSKTSEEIDAWLDEKPERRGVVDRNRKLIRFADVPLGGVEKVIGREDLDEVKRIFQAMEFKSIVSDRAWSRFRETFERLL